MVGVACGDSRFGDNGFTVVPPNPPDLSPPVVVDLLAQRPAPRTDVVWVVDNSCSMAQEQRTLANNFAQFADYFVDSNIDYHMGVVSTGFDDPTERGQFRRVEGQRWITNETQDVDLVFRDMVIMGTQGPPEERGRDQVYGALELLASNPDAPNSGFLREDALLTVVVVSDEDDESALDTKEGFLGWLLSLKEQPERVTFSSIVGPAGGCEGPGGKADSGEQYRWLTEQTGGSNWSICEPDWSSVLEDLGIRSAGLKREFFLSELPDVSTMSILLNHAGVESDLQLGTDVEYVTARNSLYFPAEIPPPDAIVQVRYSTRD